MRFLKIPELSEKDKERFFSYIDKTGDCWVWTGSCNHDGYGQFAIKSWPYFTHRISWILHGGRIYPGMVICHRCDNCRCVNPGHLFQATQSENILDMFKKGRKSHVRENNPNSKLNRSQRDVVLSRIKNGEIYSSIAKDFNVHLETVRQVAIANGVRRYEKKKN